MQFGNSIKSIRTRSNISQSALALKCGISQTTLSQIEKGRKIPGQRTIKKLCNTLEIPESVIYMLAMEEADFPECKARTFRLIYPSILNLALQIVDGESTIEDTKIKVQAKSSKTA
jgi:transcriptional regulator with XRE-family HTH domain